jgi:predicted PhzF superfamily epimerase YddE/YHI9
MNGRVLLLGTIGILAFVVGGVAGVGGSATLVDHNNVSSAQPVSDGNYSGVDVPGTESLYYEIDLNASEQVTVSTTGADEVISLTLIGPDQVKQLRRSTGDGGFGGDRDASLTDTANQDATFYVEVGTTSDSGTNVSLSVETVDLTDRFEPNDDFESAAPLSDGEATNLELAGEEVDYYAVQLNESEQLSVSTDGASEQMRVRLFAPDRVTQLRAGSGDTSFGGDLDASLTDTAEEDGTYYVEVDSLNDRSTEYSLSVQTPNLTDRYEPNDDLQSAAPVSDGQTEDLELAGEEVDYYAVQLNESEQLTVSTSGASEQMQVRLFAPDQVTELRSASGDTSFGGDLDASLTDTAEEDGTYYVEVDSLSDRSTGYSLSVQTPNLTDQYEPNDGFASATNLTRGQYSDLELAGEELDYYAVQLNASEQLTVSTSGASEQMQVRLFAPDQITELRSASGDTSFGGDLDASTAYTPLESGTYYVEVDSLSDRSTGYSLSVQTVDRTDQYEPNDEFATAPLLTRGRYSDLDVAGAERDYYFVPLNASQQVDVSLEETGGDLEATLYASNGSILTRDDNTGFGDGSVSFSYTARADGNYYLGITSPSNRSAGYRLVLNSNGTVERLPTVPSRADVSLSTSTVNASEPTDLTVTVTDARSGDAVEGATVSVSDLGVSATTDASGVATLSVDAPSPGDYPVSVSADGYADASATLTVESNDQIPSDAVYDAGSAAAAFDNDRNGKISISELATAASDYAAGDLSITALGSVANAFAAS